MKTLTDGMIAASQQVASASSDPAFMVELVTPDGEFAAVDTHLWNSRTHPAHGSLQQVHGLRVEASCTLAFQKP